MHTCIIIDDEPIAINVIKTYIERSGLLALSNTFTSPAKAFAFLQKHTVDLVFIDIQMPGLTGLEIIRSLSTKPKFIITSAYREYALDGYDLDVLDFLVKPVAYDRFLKSLSKFITTAAIVTPAPPVSPRFIFIRENRKMIKIFLDSIIYIESRKDFIRIVAGDENFTTRSTMAYYTQWLPKNEFIRVHRSFLVSMAKIKAYTEDDIEMSDGTIIPVGELYRKTFRESVQRHHFP
jgi:DNA-binding LytR/AlgR family response regulator